MNRTALLLLLSVFTTSPALEAQVLYGSIVGNVKDSSDAAIPGAQVTIKQSGTGYTRQTQSNESGQFQFPTVPGGVYEVTVTRDGFSAFSTRDLAVSVNASTRLDAVLTIVSLPSPSASKRPRPRFKPTVPRSAARSAPRNS